MLLIDAVRGIIFYNTGGKKMMKEFIFRGLIAAGFGPIVYGIVIFIIETCGVNAMQDGSMILKAILSTYMMAFICAGASVIWQNERLGLGYSALIHGTVIYISYLITYLLNGWLDHDKIGQFSIIFISGYIIIWLIIFITEKLKAKKLNQQLNK